MKNSQWSVWIARVLLVVFFAGAWFLGSSDYSAKAVLSTPADVLTALGQWRPGGGGHWSDLATTLEATFLAFLLGALAACVAAVVLVELPWLARFMSPYLAVVNVLPKVVLIPLFILWFGLGIASKLAFTGTSVFFLVFYSVYTGLSAVQTAHVQQLCVLGGGRVALLRHVYLPATWGRLLASLRLSVGFALIGTVLAEMVASDSGMGYQLAQAQATLAPAAVISLIVIIGVIAALIDACLAWLGARTSRWRAET